MVLISIQMPPDFPKFSLPPRYDKGRNVVTPTLPHKAILVAIHMCLRAATQVAHAQNHIGYKKQCSSSRSGKSKGETYLADHQTPQASAIECTTAHDASQGQKGKILQQHQKGDK